MDGRRRVVLVEGSSDRAALEVLAERRGLDLRDRGVAIVVMNGATNIRRCLDRVAPAGSVVEVRGLYDAGEEGYVRRALQASGRLPAGGSGPDRNALAAAGFHACVEDLEDELIRGLGTAAVEGVVAAEGELGALRSLQRQPAQRGRPVAAQLHRFLGSKGGRKTRYARLLVGALDLDRVPPPLEAVLAAW